jgi:Xaa-Pro dipeptidase
MRITPTTELNARFHKLQDEMRETGLDLIIVAQNADLFYFTGTVQQGLLCVPVEGEPVYMVRKDMQRARMESGLKEIVPLKSPRDLPGILSDFSIPSPEKVGLELDVLPVAFFNRIKSVLGDCQIVDATPLIRTVRAVKSDYEINIMKDAALQVDKVYKRALEVIRPGITDLELAAEIEFVARKEGHQGITRMRGFNSELFYGHVFSGADSAVPAYGDTPLGGMGLNPSFGQGASYKKIKEHEPILIDFAGAFDGYLVDQTRMFCIGELPAKLMKAYADMYSIQNRLKQIARPGVTWGAIYDECLELACDLGYKDHFMGNAGAQVSFIGHGIGVEIDEYPFIARGFNDYELKENMTFAFEPKAVFAGLGAVGIENTFWVAEDGLKHITFSKEEMAIL